MFAMTRLNKVVGNAMVKKSQNEAGSDTLVRYEFKFLGNLNVYHFMNFILAMFH